MYVDIVILNVFNLNKHYFIFLSIQLDKWCCVLLNGGVWCHRMVLRGAKWSSVVSQNGAVWCQMVECRVTEWCCVVPNGGVWCHRMLLCGAKWWSVLPPNGVVWCEMVECGATEWCCVMANGLVWRHHSRSLSGRLRIVSNAWPGNEIIRSVR